MISATLAEQARDLNLAARQRLGLSAHATLPALILMTDETRLPDPGPAIEQLPPGSAVIYRHYGLALREDFGRQLRQIAERAEVLFLVAGDSDLARGLRADGLHMPEALGFRLAEGLEEGAPPKTAENNGFTTLAAHSQTALDRAASCGASAAILSPVFATPSHPHAETLGAAKANAYAKAANLPVYALGGINEETAKALEPGGFAGIAAIGALS